MKKEKFIESKMNMPYKEALKEYNKVISDIKKIAYSKGYEAGYKKAMLARGVL